VKTIRAVALDVDGVLTDATFTWQADGTESKTFSFRDVMGISQARKAGIVFALISGESTPFVDLFAHKMGITDVHQGCKDKAAALTEFTLKYGFQFEEVCFVGDDINDLPALALVGLPTTPADAHPRVKQVARYISQAAGGKGAVREILDHILDGTLPAHNS